MYFIKQRFSKAFRFSRLCTTVERKRCDSTGVCSLVQSEEAEDQLGLIVEPTALGSDELQAWFILRIFKGKCNGLPCAAGNGS